MKIDTNRFSGFAKLYSNSRPVPPNEVCNTILKYLRKNSSKCTVDLGCGTGLSTAIWTNYSHSVIGIDPTIDMLNQAMTQFPTVHFQKGSSYSTGLPDSSADIVTCSQSFHWMEPFNTIKEVYRILNDGGVFAVYDCNWPVHWDWEAEKAYEYLFTKVNEIVATKDELNTNDVYYPKEMHLENFIKSNKFRYSTELFQQNIEPCDAERFVNIALSQGQIQKLIKTENPDVKELVQEFITIVNKSNQTEMLVSYRIIVGVK